jgi:hypothetical protein
MNGDAMTNLLILNLPAYTKASAGRFPTRVRRSFGEGGSKEALRRCRLI